MLAVLLTIIQAPSPVPRKTADSTTGARQHVKNQPTHNKPPAPASSPAINADAPGSDKTQDDGIRAENTEQPIRVTELPPVSVRPAKRDWADWGYWVFSGLLVVVGGLQIWLLFRTLRAVQLQADIYERQRVQMVKAGEQTDELLQTMRDTAMREQRAYVCISSAQIAFVQERAPEVQIRIRNYGKTPAYDVQMWIGGAFGYYPPPEELKPPGPGFISQVYFRTRSRRETLCYGMETPGNFGRTHAARRN
jgi:hypothetical protein